MKDKIQLYDYDEDRKTPKHDILDERINFMNTVKLKPCPFCGSKAEMNVMTHSPEGYDYNPRCTNPSCVGRSVKKWTNLDYAVWSWNRRVSVRFDEWS